MERCPIGRRWIARGKQAMDLSGNFRLMSYELLNAEDDEGQ
jgi:hypothetical protein